MEKDFRYKMRHIGDAFADQVGNLGHAIKGSVRGIELTYNIDGLKTEKEKVVNSIGKRVVALKNIEPGKDLISDDGLISLFNRLDKIQAQIDAYTKERKERLYPNKT